MKKILMLVPLLMFLTGCSKTEDDSMSTPPVTNDVTTNAPVE